MKLAKVAAVVAAAFLTFASGAQAQIDREASLEPRTEMDWKELKDGTLEVTVTSRGKLVRKDHYGVTGGITTTYFDTKENPAFRQEWIHRKAKGLAGVTDEYRLQRVHEYYADGKTVKRTLEMASNSRVSRSELFNSDGTKQSVRTFRADGTLEQEEVFDATGKATVTKHDASENIRESLDPKLIAQPGTGPER